MEDDKGGGLKNEAGYGFVPERLLSAVSSNRVQRVFLHRRGGQRRRPVLARVIAVNATIVLACLISGGNE
jgi:hypothetical protein